MKQIRIDDNTWEKLKEMSENVNLPMNLIVRKLVDENKSKYTSNFKW